jgi:antitoxin component of MazEF toxin-antitoxin module
MITIYSHVFKDYVGGNVVARRRIVRQGSGVYTITIPKSIVEAHRWQDTEFELEVNENRIILTPVKYRRSK